MNVGGGNQNNLCSITVKMQNEISTKIIKQNE